MIDGRRLKSFELFDKILVDAPCTTEGRFKTFEPESYGYWSPRKIREMVRKQRGLLLNAGRLLKLGGIMVYSTCTFAPEENEGVIDWLLRKTEGQLKLSPIVFPDIESYPSPVEWEGKKFSDETQKCLRILPNKMMEGFFVAKLIRR